ncbi:MAG: glycosyltransferase family 39 protein [Candidatus Saccharimonas sp.]
MQVLQFLRRKEQGIHKRDWMIIGAGLTVFALLSLGNMARWSVWFDEAFGIYLIRYNMADIAKFTAADVHPPLYYWLLKCWQTLFGNSEYALRSLSMVAIMVAMVFIYLLVRRFFSRQVAAWSLLLMVLTPFMLRYSEEARMYGLTAAFVAAATYVMVDATYQPSRKKWLLYGILVSLGMWTHYYAALAWLAHWVWRFVVTRQKTAKRSVKAFFSKDWLLAHVVAIGVFAPWLPYMIKQVANMQGGGFWIRPITLATPSNYVSNIFLYREVGETASWYSLLVVVIVVLAIILIARCTKQLSGKQRQVYWLMMIMAIVPFTILIVLSLPPLRPSFVERYLVPSVPFAVTMLAIAIAYNVKLKVRALGTITGFLVITAMTLGVMHVYDVGNINKNSNDPLPIRQTMQYMQNHSPDGMPILSSSSWRFYEMHYYDTPAHPVYFEATDNLTWGSYDMLRYNPYRKVYGAVDFARQHGGTIWYVGDWRQGSPVLPKVGKWEVVKQSQVVGLRDDQSTIRAVQIKLRASTSE